MNGLTFLKKAMEKMNIVNKNPFLLSGNRFQSVCKNDFFL
jgi:hypothetical protein